MKGKGSPMRTFVVLLAAALVAGCSGGKPQNFPSTEAAAQALVAAARSESPDALIKILGKESKPVVSSGDEVQDRNDRQRFVEAYDVAHSFDDSVEGQVSLVVGEDKWPFPFPLVENNGSWHFDDAAGVDELVSRRIGLNELSAIQTCLAFVDAEREYYARNPQQETLLHFASKLISTSGKKDGLYWPTSDEEEPSPIGEEFADARAEGYFDKAASSGQPFHGYVYRMLTAQGPSAPGGAYDYLVNDRMMGGFALLAIPAQYGTSGILSFIVNHDGVVYSRDLGPDTPKAASAITVFDPDKSWKQEAAISEP